MRTQVIRTAPQRIGVGKYLTAKGIRLKKEGASKKELLKYTKNRLQINPDSKPLTRQVIGSNGQIKNKQKHVKHLV